MRKEVLSELESLGVEETMGYGEELGKKFREEDRVLIKGFLGVGKTVLVKGIGMGLGILEEEVRSPSYNIMNIYEGRDYKMYHIDLYRVEEGWQVEELYLWELEGGLVCIEWGEKYEGRINFPYYEIELTNLGRNKRKIKLLRAIS